VLERNGAQERLHLWATANGEVRDWVSRRTLDRVALTIGFQQEVCSAPVAEMRGRWEILAGTGHCEVRLFHEYRGVTQQELPWIDAAVDRNSRAELAALKRVAETQDAQPQLQFSFADAVTTRGPADAAYSFLAAADRWPERLPHVAALELDDQPGGIQRMSMHTRASDGSTHLTESIRVCLPDGRIVYKQTTMPPILDAHTGQWTVAGEGDQVTITSAHTVRLNPTAVESVWGTAVTAGDAAARVREILSGNSQLTLAAAKAFADARA